LYALLAATQLSELQVPQYTTRRPSHDGSNGDPQVDAVKVVPLPTTLYHTPKPSGGWGLPGRQLGEAAGNPF
jgi:hypothetical protein